MAVISLALVTSCNGTANDTSTDTISKEVVTSKDSDDIMDTETNTYTINEPTNTTVENIPLNNGFQYSSMIEAYDQSSLPEEFSQVTWSEDIVFNSTEDLEVYLTQQVDNQVEQIPAILIEDTQNVSDGFFTDNIFDTNVVGSHGMQCQLQYNEYFANFMVYEVRYSTGENILKAVRTGDISTLSADELQVYNVANDFITNTLDTSKSLIEQEKQIFDYICDKVTYYNEDNPSESYPRFRSSIGGLCDGVANCMGYSDSFYLLANLAGLDVSCASDNDMLHEWNLINIDGKKYLVDTTFSDDSYRINEALHTNTHKFFNAGMDLVSNYYTFDSENPTNQIVPTCDENYYYNVFNQSTTPENVITDIKNRLSNGETSFELFCNGTMPFNSIDEFSAILQDQLPNDILSRGVSYDWKSFGTLNYFVFFVKS